MCIKRTVRLYVLTCIFVAVPWLFPKCRSTQVDDQLEVRRRYVVRLRRPYVNVIEHLCDEREQIQRLYVNRERYCLIDHNFSKTEKSFLRNWRLQFAVIAKKLKQPFCIFAFLIIVLVNTTMSSERRPLHSALVKFLESQGTSDEYDWNLYLKTRLEQRNVHAPVLTAFMSTDCDLSKSHPVGINPPDDSLRRRADTGKACHGPNAIKTFRRCGIYERDTLGLTPEWKRQFFDLAYSDQMKSAVESTALDWNTDTGRLGKISRGICQTLRHASTLDQVDDNGWMSLDMLCCKTVCYLRRDHGITPWDLFQVI